jgi:hypothetical protein
MRIASIIETHSLATPMISIKVKKGLLTNNIWSLKNEYVLACKNWETQGAHH